MLDKYLEKYKITEKDLPKKIRLDVCNLCQLNCAACWVRQSEEWIKKFWNGLTFVKFETFKELIDKHPFINEIELSNSGEIFLNPDLEKILEYAYEKNIKLSAYGGVNLNFLPETTAEALVKYNLTEMNVAIDGATPETYAIYRRRGDFNAVINNVKLINKYKKIYNSKYPVLTYRFIIFGHNEHEIEDAKKLAKDLDMEIEFAVNAIQNYSPVKNKELVRELTNIVDTDNKTNEEYLKYKNKETDWFYCSDLFNSPQFDSNGYLQGCCIFFSRYEANIFKEGLLNVLNNEKVLYAKAMLKDYSIPIREDLPCSKCGIYKFLKENDYHL